MADVGYQGQHLGQQWEQPKWGWARAAAKRGKRSSCVQPTIQRLKQIRTISGGTGRATPQSSHRDSKGQTLPQVWRDSTLPSPFPICSVSSTWSTAGGKDDPLRQSLGDKGQNPVHTKPWCRTGQCGNSCLVSLLSLCLWFVVWGHQTQDLMHMRPELSNWAEALAPVSVIIFWVMALQHSPCTAHSEVGPSTSIINQGNAPQTWKSYFIYGSFLFPNDTTFYQVHIKLDSTPQILQGQLRKDILLESVPNRSISFQYM